MFGRLALDKTLNMSNKTTVYQKFGYGAIWGVENQIFLFYVTARLPMTVFTEVEHFWAVRFGHAMR
jgi:hypothetical protein